MTISLLSNIPVQIVERLSPTRVKVLTVRSGAPLEADISKLQDNTRGAEIAIRLQALPPPKFTACPYCGRTVRDWSH